VLQSARGFSVKVAGTAVDEVTKHDQCQHNTYHNTPSFLSALNINSRIASQMRIRRIALEICFTGVNVSIISLIKVVLNSILGHNITSLVCVLFVFVSFGLKIEHQAREAM
jgi:hypothetical protein